MNISEFREKYPQYKDIDDQTLADKFHAKFYADIPKDQFNAKFLTSAAAPSATQQIPRSTGSWLNEVPKYTRPALEVGGALAGGVLGATAGPVGAVAGAGLGMAAGRQIQNAMEERTGMRPSATLPQALGSTAQGALQGAALEAGGAVFGKGIEYGLQQVAKAAPRIYESVAKIPPRSVPKLDRDRAISTALEHEIPATQKGLGKLRGKIEDLNDKISQVIEGAKNTSHDKVSIGSVLGRLEDVKKWAARSFADPTPVLKAIEEYKVGVSATRGGSITVSEAQKLKQGIYRRLTDSAYGEFSTASKEMDKAFARGIKEELLQQFPQLQKLNAEDSALIGLSNILEKTVNRTRNWDVAGLSEYGGAIGGGTVGGGPGAAIGLMVAKMLRSPAVMSKVAFALNKAGRVGGFPTVARAIGYGAGKAITPNISGPVSRGVEKMDPAMPAAAAELPGREGLPAYKRGIEAYTSNRWDDAIREWQKALKEEPGRAREIIGFINRAKAEKKGAERYKQPQRAASL